MTACTLIGAVESLTFADRQITRSLVIRIGGVDVSIPITDEKLAEVVALAGRHTAGTHKSAADHNQGMVDWEQHPGVTPEARAWLRTMDVPTPLSTQELLELLNDMPSSPPSPPACVGKDDDGIGQL